MPDRVLHYFSYDGEIDLPEEGIADVNGRPHYFWLREEGSEPRTAFFDLAPVDPDLLGWVTEVHAIWHEWDLAYHAGRVDLASHPGRAGNHPRFADLTARIEGRAIALRELSTIVV